MGVLDGFAALFTGVNKVDTEGGDEQAEGIVSPLLPELQFDKSEDELIQMAKRWKKAWEEKAKKIDKIQKENERYWLGKHFTDVEYAVEGTRPTQENRIFSDVETFLPIVTRQNPEPLVSAGESKGGEELATKVAKMLAYQTDRQKLKLILKKSARYWLLYLIGVVKFGWDTVKDDISTYVIRPQKLIFDPDAVIDENGYHGAFLGEVKRDIAEDLIKKFPKAKDDIEKACNNKLWTKVGYIEWWTNEYVFWTLGEKLVLDKLKNPHFNYEQTQATINEEGDAQKQIFAFKNHFKAPSMPYRFLTVFNLGLGPHDDANLVQQNLSTQDQLNKRLRQIDENVDDMNGGAVVSGDHFTEEEASQVANALKKGKTIWVPAGNVNDAYKRERGVPMPADVFNNVLDLRNQMDNLFGIHGTTRGERTGPETLGGRILLKGSDVDRITFISDYIEQHTDDIYNYWVQMMHVYYDKEHVASLLGEERTEDIVLSRTDFNHQLEVDRGGGVITKEPVELLISVREGSMIPKDPVIKRNEAVDLFKINALDPITLFERLDFANPRESAKKLFLWLNKPDLLFPEIKEEFPELAQAEGGLPVPEEVMEEPEAPEGMPPEEEMPEIGPGIMSILAGQ